MPEDLRERVYTPSTSNVPKRTELKALAIEIFAEACVLT
jgi:hypothetical protein